MYPMYLITLETTTSFPPSTEEGPEQVQQGIQQVWGLQQGRRAEDSSCELCSRRRQPQ